MKYVILLAALALTACGGHYTPLPKTEAGDPVFQLNPGMWAATANDLVAAPVVAAPTRPAPAGTIGSAR
jgi:hypothetical protein